MFLIQEVQKANILFIFQEQNMVWVNICPTVEEK